MHVLGSHTANKCPFHAPFNVTSFRFLCFALGSSPLEMAPERSAEVLWNAPQCKKVVRCLTGKFCVLSNLFSCISDSTIGYESHVMNQQYIK